MVPMALAGGSAVSSFAVPMLFGIVICASSSVFIAAPILLFLGEGRLRSRRKPDAAEAEIIAGFSTHKNRGELAEQEIMPHQNPPHRHDRWRPWPTVDGPRRCRHGRYAACHSS
jgi:hypothetical protein